MTADDTRALIQRFFDALAARDTPAVLACLADDVVHDVNQGGERRIGRPRFEAYLARMQHHYEEATSDLVILVSDDGTRAAAEYNMAGRYVQTEEGMPPAHGQSYTLPAAMFFTANAGRLSRVTAYYNLTDWITQIAREPAGRLQ